MMIANTFWLKVTIARCPIARWQKVMITETEEFQRKMIIANERWQKLMITATEEFQRKMMIANARWQKLMITAT